MACANFAVPAPPCCRRNTSHHPALRRQMTRSPTNPRWIGVRLPEIFRRRSLMKEHPDLSTATGAGVRVALIDSGVNAQHSHVGFVAGGVAFSAAADGRVQEHGDYSDRIGH